MAPNTSAEPRPLDRFTQATAAYIVPCLLIVSNVMNNYDNAEFNIFAGIYLLTASLYRYESLENSGVGKFDSKKRKIWNPIFNTIGDICFDIFYDSGENNPTYFEGRAGLNDDIRYQFQALRSDRVIPSELTIWKAVDHEVKKGPESKFSCTQCLNLVETLNGYLKVGPVDKFDEELYCGPTLSWNHHCDAKNEGNL
ncbi:hypothetical protein FHETE_5317 [Fusarium heterosporum]|uniref:Uncharacterized protein n=1 Tax=Fusarium heterosporum TaxID=42747 RepID=A0A8H5TBZ7_FUSHE|nr:hypothetical protein FHETE_5317 [Fusarium heterosporum]